MHQYIVKSSVRSKATHNLRHIYTSTSKHAVIDTIMSAESTNYTLQLSTIKRPRRAVSVQITFEVSSRRQSESIEIFSVAVFHTHAHPMTTRTLRGIGVDDQ